MLRYRISFQAQTFSRHTSNNRADQELVTRVSVVEQHMVPMPAGRVLKAWTLSPASQLLGEER